LRTSLRIPAICCYLVVKAAVRDDRLPTASRLNTWKKYVALRVRPVMVTE
jgi:hypothetical protein